MKRTIVIPIIILSLFFLSSLPARADTFIDDFTNDSYIDTSKTTAYYNSTDKCVELPKQTVPNAVAIQDLSQGYAVATTGGIKMYEIDDATGKVAENPAFSCNFATDSIGVALRQDNLSIWSINQDSIAYYRHEGGAMSNNPGLKVSGLINLISVAGYKNNDKGVVLKKDNDGNAVVERFEVVGAQLQSTFTYNTNISDPVAVSIVNESPDFRLATKDSIYYFMYDDGTGGYVEDPARKITGLASVTGVSSSETGNTIMTSGSADYFINLDGGGAVKIYDYSVSASDVPVAVSSKSDAVEYAYINEAGELKYYILDDAEDMVKRDAGLEPSAAFTLNRGYLSPRQYYSKAYTTAQQYDAVMLKASVDAPAGTQVKFQVSSDGVTFTDIQPDTWLVVPRGSNFVVKAELSTTDKNVTPEIKRVELTIGDDFQIVASVVPSVAERGRNIQITARAVKLITGETVQMDTMRLTIPMTEKADGTPALPDGHLPQEALMTNTGYQWEYTCLIGEKTVVGRWPDDGIYKLKVTGTKGAVTREAELSLEVKGHILSRLIVRTYS
ncbi:MAG: hypothetical protein ACOY46_09770 [Bacillota bacterium]